MINKYQSLSVKSDAMLTLLWSPLPVAVMHLQTELLQPNVLAALLMVGSIYGLMSRPLNKYLTFESALRWGVWLTALFIVTFIIAALTLDDVYWLLFLGPIVGGLRSRIDIVSDTKFIEQYKTEFDISKYQAACCEWGSAAMIIGQGLSIALYSVFGSVDYADVYVYGCIGTNVLFGIVGIQKLVVANKLAARTEMVTA